MIELTEGHTVKRYDSELGHLHLQLLEMGGLVIDQVGGALQALLDRNLEAAHRVLEREPAIDNAEVHADEEIAEVIARRGPMGRDLRTVMAISKAVTDLERVGDEAVKIADIALQIYDNDSSPPNAKLLRDVGTMGKQALSILQQAIEVFDRMDAGMAANVIHAHAELDAEFQSGLRRLATFILEDARNVGHTINVTLVIRTLERIGDYSKNIAEYVIYLVVGEDVRDQQENTDHPDRDESSGNAVR